MYRGVLIRESLAATSVLDIVNVVSTETVDIASPAAGQPATWTIVTFEIDDDRAAQCAQIIADELSPGPWYVDFNDGERSYVVFSGRVFAYERGDEVRLREARTYAREQGIPEGQIDWAVPG